MTSNDVIFTSKVPLCQVAIYWVLRGELFLSLTTSPKNTFFQKFDLLQIQLNQILLLPSNEYKLEVFYETTFTGPDSVRCKVNQACNQDPPLQLAEPELIYRGEIRAWI